MVYNIFGETDKKIKWEELHKKVMPKELVEYIPMPGKGINGGDAIGICIPSKNIGNKAWKELEAIVDILGVEYQFNLYDMFYGAKIDSELLKKIKENLAT